MRQLFFILVATLFVISEVSSQSDNTDYQYALIEAVKQKNLGNIQGAIELYNMVIEANYSVSVAHYEVGTLYALMNQNDKAYMHLKTAVDQDPDNIWYGETYLDYLIMSGKYKEANSLLKQKLKKNPDNVDIDFKLANLYFVSGKTKKSLKILKSIEKQYGVSDKITLLKANIYESRKDYESALNEVDNILLLVPESVEFRVAAAELAMKDKQRDRAAEYYNDVYKVDSTNIYAITNLTDYYREKKDFKRSFFFLNKSFESLDIEYDKKMAILASYLSDQYFFTNYNSELKILVNTMLRIYNDKREIHLFASDFFIQTRDYPEALSALEIILNRDEKRYELWKQGILLANATGLSAKALNLSNMAYELFPDSVEIVFYKGLAEYEMKEYGKVIATFSVVTLQRFSDIEVLSQSRSILAESHYRMENYPVADSLFRDIIMKEPDNYMVMNNFSYYLALRNMDLEEAKSLSYQVVKNNPDNGTFLDTYAWILYKLGNYEEAEIYINLALEKGGENDPDVNEHAAEIHLSLESFHLARSFFQKALILGGDERRLIQRLKEIPIVNE